MKDQTAVVGVGATEYYKRGRSLPQTQWPDGMLWQVTTPRSGPGRLINVEGTC